MRVGFGAFINDVTKIREGVSDFVTVLFRPSDPLKEVVVLLVKLLA